MNNRTGNDPGNPYTSPASAPQTTPDHAVGEPWKGRLLCLLAAIFWSSNGLFVKSPAFADWPADSRGLVLAFWRNVFASAVLILFVRRVTWDWKLLPMALSFTLMSITFLSSMVFTTAANAIWLQNTAPLWILLSGRFVYHEPFDRRNLVPLATGLLGAALIIVCETTLNDSRLSSLGVLLGTISGLFYAVVVVSMRRLREASAAWLITVNHATAALLLAPFALPLWNPETPWPQGEQWPLLAAFGILQMGIPYALFAQGLKHIGGQEGAAVGLLEPVLVPIWVWLTWGEVPAPWTIAGGGLIMLGLSWRYLRRG